MPKTNSKKLIVWVAGSTQRTVGCAQALLDRQQFNICAILTPGPKIIGREKESLLNPLHQLAEAQKLPTILIDKKIDTSVQIQVENLIKQVGPPDFLLVVDFGYIIPNWLLQLPKLAPVNVHPSLLPRWRGSSPGQFVLLAGEEESGVSFMRVESGVDTGAVYQQVKFSIDQAWTSTEYYKYCFDLAAELLPSIMSDIATGLVPISQPETSPTPEARQLQRQDGFLPWSSILQMMDDQSPTLVDLPQLWLAVAGNSAVDSLTILARAVRALSPWPGVWTLVSTAKGEKRMKILSVKMTDEKLSLVQVQIEGQQPAAWNQVKNVLTEN